MFHQGGNKVQDSLHLCLCVLLAFVHLSLYLRIRLYLYLHFSACIFVYLWRKCWTVQAVTKRHLLD